MFDAERDQHRLTKILSAIAADVSLPPITLASCRRCLLDGPLPSLGPLGLHARARTGEFAGGVLLGTAFTGATPTLV